MAPNRPEGLVLQRDGHRGQAVLAFDLESVAYLRSDEGRGALAAVAALPLTPTSLVADIASARTRFGARAGILVETVQLRRKAADKLPGTADWLFTDEALQQATAGVVAAHRARRLTGSRVHDATCSIGTELAALADRAAYVVGSDLDPVRLAMARHNLGPAVPLLRADALRPVTRDTVVLLDPARRSGGRRTFDPRRYTPPLDEALDTYAGRDVVVKCAPGIDFGALRHLGFSDEIEITSYAGSVREACLWSAGLTPAGVTRRASVIDRGEDVTDAEPDDCPVASAGRWIIDPDGAIVRAGLVRHYAARHGLWQLDPEIAYLSGDRLPDGVRGFEVLEQVTYQEKRLRQALATHDAGSVEILVRGVDVDPDVLRRRLRPRGSAAVSVVVTRLGSGTASRATAFICRPSH
ncbi:class I SAM-dependent methyltransferase [Mycobacterium sp. IS-1496]|uniref:THUMP-like domain-containing protein n=1 Tax=Mycobacterium sp. IS-1496 TaxID=1772284 RepID=UPI0009E81E5C|nr:class I SAM-dependent methyltransferase [Mycobacterium sp. IS-1496]